MGKSNRRRLPRTVNRALQRTARYRSQMRLANGANRRFHFPRALPASLIRGLRSPAYPVYRLGLTLTDNATRDTTAAWFVGLSAS